VVGSILPGSRTAILPDPSLSVITPKEDLWRAVLEHLSTQLSKDTFNKHLLGSTASQVNGTLTIAPYHAASVSWLEGRLRRTVALAVAHVAGEELAIEFISHSEESHVTP